MLDTKQQQRLEELRELKKTRKLSSKEFKELKSLERAEGKVPNHKQDKPEVGGPGNAFAWWNKEPALLKDAVNYKCNYIAGTPIAGPDITYVPAGVMSITLHPVYGNSKFQTDPLNVWARDLYLRMFQKYRGITSYSAADLGITLIAAIEVVRSIALYERIYGVINRYSKLNINMPSAELSALSISASDANTLRGRLSDFRYDLNLLIRKAQRLCVPKDIASLADNISLFGYEYLDHDSARAQIIIFNPAAGGVYQDTDLIAGGSIVFEPWASGSIFDFNAENMCAFLDNQLNALLGSDSVQKIFADLTVWFGENAMMAFLPLPSEYIVLPVKSDAILHKMHNIETYPNRNYKITPLVHTDLDAADVTKLEDDKSHIYQLDDTIISAQSMSRNTGTIAWVSDLGWLLRSSSDGGVNRMSAHVLDTYRADPDPEVIVEGALFKYHLSEKTVSSNVINEITTCAFFIAVYVTLYTMRNGSPSAVSFENIVSSGSTAQANAAELTLIDWAPLVYTVYSAGVVANIYGDIDNIIPMYSNDIARLQRTCVLSGLHSDVQVVNK